MSGRMQNYRVLNTDLGCNCGHKHHSRDSAIKCADGLGWIHDIVLERFDSRAEGMGKKSVHCGKRRLSIEESRMRYYMIY